MSNNDDDELQKYIDELKKEEEAVKPVDNLKIVLTFMDTDNGLACRSFLESNDPDQNRDFMELKLMDMSPAEACASVALKAAQKLGELYKLQIDIESVHKKDPGFVSNELDNDNKVIYH